MRAELFTVVVRRRRSWRERHGLPDCRRWLRPLPRRCEEHLLRHGCQQQDHLDFVPGLEHNPESLDKHGVPDNKIRVDLEHAQPTPARPRLQWEAHTVRRRMSKPGTLTPRATRFRAMGKPMAPRPTKPTAVIASPSLQTAGIHSRGMFTASS